PGTREPPTDQLARSLPLIGLVDIRHRVGDMRFGDALLPELTLECAPRPAPATTPTPHPFGREIGVVEKSPGPDALHGLVDGVGRVFRGEQSLPELVLAPGPVLQEAQTGLGRVVCRSLERRQVGGRGAAVLDRGHGRPEFRGSRWRGPSRPPHQNSTGTTSIGASSSSDPASISAISAPAPILSLSRILRSISSRTAGFSLRYRRAFSLPWPSWSEPYVNQEPDFLTKPLSTPMSIREPSRLMPSP